MRQLADAAVEEADGKEAEIALEEEEEEVVVVVEEAKAAREDGDSKRASKREGHVEGGESSGEYLFTVGTQRLRNNNETN